MTRYAQGRYKGIGVAGVVEVGIQAGVGQARVGEAPVMFNGCPRATHIIHEIPLFTPPALCYTVCSEAAAEASLGWGTGR